MRNFRPLHTRASEARANTQIREASTRNFLPRLDEVQARGVDIALSDLTLSDPKVHKRDLGSGDKKTRTVDWRVDGALGNSVMKEAGVPNPTQRATKGLRTPGESTHLNSDKGSRSLSPRAGPPKTKRGKSKSSSAQKLRSSFKAEDNKGNLNVGGVRTRAAPVTFGKKSMKKSMKKSKPGIASSLFKGMRNAFAIRSRNHQAENQLNRNKIKTKDSSDLVASNLKVGKIEDEGWEMCTDKKSGLKFFWNSKTNKSQLFHPWLKQGATVLRNGIVGTVVSGIYQLPVIGLKDATNSESFVVDIAVDYPQDDSDVPAICSIHDRVPVLDSLTVVKPAETPLSSLREKVASGWATKPHSLKGMRLIGAELDARVEGLKEGVTGRVTGYNSSTNTYTVKFENRPASAYSLDDIYACKPRLPPAEKSSLPMLRQQTRFAPAGAVVDDCPGSHGLKGFVAEKCYICDICETKVEEGNALFGCRSCDYDLCSECHASPLVMDCQGRHGLNPLSPKDMNHFTFHCDLCLSTIVDGVSHRCEICDFDVCQKCYHQPYVATCGERHILRAFRTPARDYKCDRCQASFPKRTRLYGCRQCDFDLCAACYVSSSAALNPNLVHVSSIIERCFMAYSNRPCLGYERDVESGSETSKWQWLTYGSVSTLMREIIVMLESNGIFQGSYVGISGDNSMGYFCSYFALFMGGYRPVPLSVHLDPKTISKIVQEAKIVAVFVSDGTIASKFRQSQMQGARSCSEVKISYDSPDKLITVPIVFNCLHLTAEKFQSYVKENTQSSTFTSQFSGKRSPWIGGASPESLEMPLLILYTSGSTGSPKGAIMSERSFLNEMKEMISLGEWDSSDVSLIDSPMATSATPYNIMGSLLNGGRMCVYKDLVRVFDVSSQVGPSSLGLVPQMFAILYKSYQQELEKLRVGFADQEQGSLSLIEEKEAMLKRKYRYVKLGWRLSCLNCGGATPMPIVQRWLKAIYEDETCSVTENYASTEAGPITSSWGAHGSDTCGVVKEDVDLKLVSWGEYRSTDKPHPRGEICVKSPCMTSGYLNRPDLTKSAFDDEGYYRTGDIGELIDAGPPMRIRVIDRCKNMFKLLNGEWVSPENVEAELLARCSLIRQIMVYGSSSHAQVVGIVVPQRLTEPSNSGLLSEQEVKGLIMAQLKACLVQPIESEAKVSAKRPSSVQLRHFEIPNEICLSDSAFTSENGMLTQTKKVCRPVIQRIFAEQLRHMLESQQASLEEDESAQRYTIARILRKYIQQYNLSSKIVVLEEDQEEWSHLRWDSVATTSTHSIIQLSFPETASAIDPGWLWNTNMGRSIHECVQRLSRGTFTSKINWENECKLDAEVVNSDPAADMSISVKEESKIVFFTGGTGFLGSGLLAGLCDKYISMGVDIWCLVRVRNGHANVMEHLTSSLENREQMTPGLKQAIENGRIRAVKGDLGVEFLGMESKELFYHIASRVCCIVHCGCHVNHVFDYTTLKAANVGSVDSLALMCAIAPTSAKPDFIYISTISVLDDASMLNEGAGSIEYITSEAAGGYSQSKWVAEMRLRNYSQVRKIFRTLTIIRPGLIGFDSRTGSANRSDWFTRFLVGTLQMGAVRLSSKGQYVSVTPVDHAAEFIIGVMQARCEFASSKFTGQGNDILTLHIPVTVNMETKIFMQHFLASTEFMGRLVRAVEADEWSMLLQSLPKENAFSAFNDGRFDGGFDGIEPHPSKKTEEWIREQCIEFMHEPECCYTELQIRSLVAYLLRSEPLLKRRLLLRTLSSS